MTPERWSQIKGVFAQVTDLPSDKRTPMLSRLCQGDWDLQSEIERLLAEYDAAEGFLEGTPSLTTAANLLQPGERVAGRYEIVGFLGRGGMGEVYEAEDHELSERIAIKMIRYDPILYEDLMERLRREVQLARRVTHPNVCRVFDLGYHNYTGCNLIFLTMELIKGETLSSRISSQGKFTTADAMPIARQLCAALEAAHQSGILHRDFKCSNVMLLGSGSQVRAVVTDFGIARQLQSQSKDETQGGATRQGAVVGTPTYMSPEQLMGEKLTEASDIYSLGLVLYEMVTGLRPFRGESNWREMLKRLSGDPPAPIEVVPNLDPRWNRTILGCLQRKPVHRFSSVRQVADSLQHRFRYSWKDLSLIGRTAVVAGPIIFVAGIAVAAIPAARHITRVAFVQLMAAGRGGEAAVPDEPFALRTQAQVYLERWDVATNLDRAIRMLNRSLELDHDNAPAYAGLTLAFYEKNRLNPDPLWAKQADQSASRALQLDSDLVDAHLASGIAAMMAGRIDEAEHEFRRAVDLDPRSARPHRWLGNLLGSSGKNQEAEGELARALALNDKEWRARLGLGFLHYKTARYAEAAADWEQVSKLTPGNFVVLRNLGAVYHMMGRDDDAASAFQRSLEIKPDANTYGNLGTLRFFQGRYEEAVPAFEKAAQMGASQYVVWGNLGDAYRWAPGQNAKAKAAYENAIRLARETLATNPDDPDLKSRLALYLAKSGDRQASLNQIQQLESLGKKPASVLFKSAIVHELCGERDYALAALSEAIQAGYPLNEVKQEPELIALRTDARYQLMLAAAAQK